MIEVRCSMTFFIIQCHYHWHQHHVMQKALLMAPLHSLGQDNQNEVQHYFLVMWHHWHQHQHHMMLLALSIAPVHSLCPADQSEVQHDISGHVMSLALVLASHDAISILNVTITFCRFNMTFFGFMTQLPLALASYNAIGVGIIWYH